MDQPIVTEMDQPIDDDQAQESIVVNRHLASATSPPPSKRTSRRSNAHEHAFPITPDSLDRDSDQPDPSTLADALNQLAHTRHSSRSPVHVEASTEETDELDMSTFPDSATTEVTSALSATISPQGRGNFALRHESLEESDSETEQLVSSIHSREPAASQATSMRISSPSVPISVPKASLSKSHPRLSPEALGKLQCRTCRSKAHLTHVSSDDSDFDEVSTTSSMVVQERSDGEKRLQPIKRRDGEVALVVGGRRFIMQLELLRKHPDTMLGRMFSADSHFAKPNEVGDYVISYSVTACTFKAILDFYKEGRIRCPPNVAVSELHEACNYFLIPFTDRSVKCDDLGKFLEELSSSGAQSQFKLFIDEHIISAMGRSAQIGDRECHIVVLNDGETVEWDDDIPPRLGEQYAQLIHSTALIRFLRYHENRDVAKGLLKERGLKKIKIGIEGYPTGIARIITTSTGEKVEVEYNYQQRPFLRLSWQKGESKHVDFQCVRVRGSSVYNYQ